MYSVIMAGGSDNRFWPLSREDRSKYFLDLTGNGPMVQETYNRLSPVVQDEEMIIVVGDQHIAEANKIFKDKKITLLSEPIARNTAPCIGLGTIYARYLGCEKPIAFVPAGHYVKDRNGFLRALEHAGTISEQGGIVTLGIVPTRPETLYGYIRRSRSYSDSSGYSVYEVSSFEEKPNLDKANDYMRSGEHYWNAGIFVATPDTILTEIKKYLPNLFSGLMSLEKSLENGSFHEDLKLVYPDFEDISFAYGIMEKTKAPLYVVPCDCGWSNINTWELLYQQRSSDYDKENNLSDGDTLFVDCKNSFVSTEKKKFVACLGIENLIIVDTDDALLIANTERSHDIAKITEYLTKKNKKELL
jgi:mannose-1-phosphate guanylyltransferase